jgi:hypothetical protein
MTSSVVSVDSNFCDRSDVVQQNTEDVLAQLRCPVCLHFVRREIKGYLCKNKHYCCNECQQSVTHCPICRTTTWSTCPPTNALLGEFILRNELTTCRYDKRTNQFEGCTLESRYETLVEVHEKRCSGRLVTCPGIGIGGCNFLKRPIQKLSNHMKNDCSYLSRKRVSYEATLTCAQIRIPARTP